ncbi:MAG TPA: DNA polymerase III subunit delta [Edaphocola sp.]|nr:DNA polymerase III subunit delta [Edaphocola sp.]
MAKAKKEKIDTLAEYNKIISLLRSKQYSSIYLLEGEEAYYIDKILDVFNEEILSADEKDFNLITLYGKETNWSDVINSCNQFPMYGDHIIVILREAVQLNKIEELIPYFKKPSASTIFVIDYRGKETNSKDKWVKPLKENGGVIFKSQSLDEMEIPSWIQQYGANRNIKIDFPIAETLASYLGNDLMRITNEIQKVLINEPDLKDLSADLIEKYIGISRDYNYLDLPRVIFQNDTKKLSRMLNYFIANPKSIPLPPLVATLYTFADRIYRCYSVPNDFNNPESRSLYYYREYAAKYNIHTIHQFIAILNDFALKAVGIGTIPKSNGELVKELAAQLNRILYPQEV